MGEESKVRVTTRPSHHRVIPSKARNLKSPPHMTPGRHTGFKAVSTAQAHNKPTQPTESTSPLTREESKVRVNKPTPTNTPARHTGLYPSFPRRRETTRQGKQQTNTNHIPRPVILASRQYPQGRAHNKSNTTDRIHLSLDERGIKGEGAPVPDTGPEGKQDKPTTLAPSLRA